MPFEAKEVYEYLRSFEAGVNQGVDPSLLQKNQLANGVNLTVRGTMARPRPQFRKTTLSFATDAVRDGAETGYFQGGCFYQPTVGSSHLMAAISGRLFRFTPDSGSGASVTEHTIAGDANPATQSQAWLWQCENFLIWTDGTSLPVFFGGNLARRSAGPSVNLGTTSAGFTVPAVNSNVTLTLSANYEGPLNAVVNIGNFGSYIVVAVGTPPSGSAGYDATLRNGNDTAGNTIAVGTPVIQPGVTNIVGTTAAAFNVPNGSTDNGTVVVQFTASLSSTYSVPGLAQQFTMAGRRYRTTATVDIALHKYRLLCLDLNTSGSTVTVPSGTTAFDPNITPAPDVIIGTVSAVFVVPAIGSNVTVQLSTLWTGSAGGTAVKINSKNYTIFPVTQAVIPSTTIVVKNLTDSPTTSRSSGLNLLTLGELPIGRMGAYGRGRNWMCLIDGLSFIASDIVGGSSGTTAYNFKDAPLKITENSYLNGGGVFVVPSSGEEIRAMTFTATLDVSLGQGPLQVLTSVNAFSCDTPVDRAVWQSVTNPILTESLISNGAQGQDSTITVNSDLVFRSVDGIRSLVLARRDFETWGNVPQSREVQPTLDADNPSLLPFGSAVAFDNRNIITSAPSQSSQGVYHSSFVVMNLDPISSLRGKAPSVYDGVWTGLNTLKLIKGRFSGVERLFAFHVNTDESKIELYEILNSSSSVGDGIEWTLESATLFEESNPAKKMFLRLMDGEIYVDQLSGTVEFKAFYKPNQWPDWVPWHSWTVNAGPDDPAYRPRMGLGEPSPDPCDNVNNMPLREGHDFQFKLTITGQCRFRGARFKAFTAPQPAFAPPA